MIGNIADDTYQTLLTTGVSQLSILQFIGDPGFGMHGILPQRWLSDQHTCLTWVLSSDWSSGSAISLSSNPYLIYPDPSSG